MRFMILMTEDPSWDDLDTAGQEEVIAAHEQFESDLKASGSYVDSARFNTAVALGVLQSGGDKLEVPIPVSGKGSIGGYYLIEAGDLSEAMNWAKRCRFIAGYNWVYPVWTD